MIDLWGDEFWYKVYNMENARYNEMETLKFALYYDPYMQDYELKSYPWFVNSKYMSDDIIDDEGTVNKLMIDVHKKYLFYTSKLADELLASLRDTWPRDYFVSLDEKLREWKEDFQRRYNDRKVFLSWTRLQTPTPEILKAWNDLFAEIDNNIKKIENDACWSIPEYAHHVAQALLAKQKVFLTPRK